MKFYKELIFLLEDQDSFTKSNYLVGTHEWNFSNYVLRKPIIDLAVQENYKKLEQIGKEEKYFFVKNGYNCNFIRNHKNVGFKRLPQQVLDDVKNNKAKIIINVAGEGFSGGNDKKFKDDLDIIQTWIDDAGLPPTNVYYFNGNLISNDIKSDKVKYHVVPLFTFEGWTILNIEKDISDYTTLEFEPADKFLYINLNRTPRTHRLYLLASLRSKNLFDDGQNSFNMECIDSQHCFEELTALAPPADILKNAEEIKSIGKLFVDVDNSDLNVPHFNVDSSLYKKTFISLITETTTFNNSIFITEKTMRAILHGHPFIILGNKGLLKRLKDLGYKTFDQWIDESYDDYDTIQEKVEIICKNLESLKEKGPAALIKIRNEMSEICDYNQRHFIAQLQHRYFIEDQFVLNKPVLDAIQDIKNNW